MATAHSPVELLASLVTHYFRLHLAVSSVNYDIVRICLEHGAKIDVRQESQATPFHFACSQGTLSIVKLMLEHHLKQRGEAEGRVVLAMTDNAGMTPLHRAAMFDHADVVQYLIQQVLKS